jgi:hypothetical protein
LVGRHITGQDGLVGRIIIGQDGLTDGQNCFCVQWNGEQNFISWDGLM